MTEPDKQARLAAALRANLRKRKAQARAAPNDELVTPITSETPAPSE